MESVPKIDPSDLSMLFLLKRTIPSALGGLLVLSATGLLLRSVLSIDQPTIAITTKSVGTGVLACAAILASDGCVHVLMILIFGAAYRQRHHELAEVFRGQTTAALVSGALMAGIGEELVFRGLSTSPVYLVTAAVGFGSLHYIRRSLALYTLWSIWEGLLLAAALWLTEALVVTMVAHFLHDAAGFLIFRRERQRAFPVRPAAPVHGA